jgi:hypothetical protein
MRANPPLLAWLVTWVAAAQATGFRDPLADFRNGMNAHAPVGRAEFLGQSLRRLARHEGGGRDDRSQSPGPPPSPHDDLPQATTSPPSS